jgi:acyl-coenzyme A thioesterase PaaI-like protein
MTVRYVKPASTGVAYTVKGRCLEDKGKIVLAESELVDAEDTQIARASGKLFKVRE